MLKIVKFYIKITIEPDMKYFVSVFVKLCDFEHIILVYCQFLYTYTYIFYSIDVFYTSTIIQVLQFPLHFIEILYRFSSKVLLKHLCFDLLKLYIQLIS